MHQDGFIMSQFMVEKLLNIDQLKLKIIEEFGHAFGIVGKNE